MMRLDKVRVPPFPCQLQLLGLSGERFCANGQGGAFQRVDFDGVVRPICAFIQRSNFRLLSGTLAAEHPQHFPVKILVSGAVVQSHFCVDAGFGKLTAEKRAGTVLRQGGLLQGL